MLNPPAASDCCSSESIALGCSQPGKRTAASIRRRLESSSSEAAESSGVATETAKATRLKETRRRRIRIRREIKRLSASPPTATSKISVRRPSIQKRVVRHTQSGKARTSINGSLAEKEVKGSLAQKGMENQVVNKTGDVCNDWKSALKQFFDCDPRGCLMQSSSCSDSVKTPIASGKETAAATASASKETVTMFTNEGLYCVARFYCQLYERLAQVKVKSK